MRKPQPSLKFYLKHSADVDALWGEEAAPEGIAPEDWAKFRTVLALVGEEVAGLLVDVRDAALEGLEGVAVPFSTGSYANTISRDWNAWRGFKLKGKGNKSRVGLVGVCLEAESASAPRLTGYVAFDDEGADGFKEAASANLVSPSEQNYWDKLGRVAICSRPLDGESNLDEVIEEFGTKFADIAEALKKSCNPKGA